jgi:hypothetical protein
LKERAGNEPKIAELLRGFDPVSVLERIETQRIPDGNDSVLIIEIDEASAFIQGEKFEHLTFLKNADYRCRGSDSARIDSARVQHPNGISTTNEGKFKTFGAGRSAISQEFSIRPGAAQQQAHLGRCRGNLVYVVKILVKSPIPRWRTVDT